MQFIYSVFYDKHHLPIIVYNVEMVQFNRVAIYWIFESFILAEFALQSTRSLILGTHYIILYYTRWQLISTIPKRIKYCNSAKKLFVERAAEKIRLLRKKKKTKSINNIPITHTVWINSIVSRALTLVPRTEWWTFKKCVLLTQRACKHARVCVRFRVTQYSQKSQVVC